MYTNGSVYVSECPVPVHTDDRSRVSVVDVQHAERPRSSPGPDGPDESRRRDHVHGSHLSLFSTLHTAPAFTSSPSSASSPPSSSPPHISIISITPQSISIIPPSIPPSPHLTSHPRAPPALHGPKHARRTRLSSRRPRHQRRCQRPADPVPGRQPSHGLRLPHRRGSRHDRDDRDPARRRRGRRPWADAASPEGARARRLREAGGAAQGQGGQSQAAAVGER